LKTEGEKLKKGAEKNEVEKVSIHEQETDELVSTLTNNMVNIKKLDLLTIEESIKIADEIIFREPGSYSAYKAKLILMVLKENKFNQNIDDYEFNKTLDNIAGFEIANNEEMRRESVLMATVNDRLTVLENKLDDISIVRDEILIQSAGIDKMSSAYHNEDVVEVPFLRLMSNKDYITAEENARTFIEQFPDSPSGYYYLVKALEFQGRMDEALQIIEELESYPRTRVMLQEKLNTNVDDDFKTYWEKLSF
jgi:hypothetical protein